VFYAEHMSHSVVSYGAAVLHTPTHTVWYQRGHESHLSVVIIYLVKKTKYVWLNLFGM